MSLTEEASHAFRLTSQHLPPAQCRIVVDTATVAGRDTALPRASTSSV